jgi:hypothetical protein
MFIYFFSTTTKTKTITSNVAPRRGPAYSYTAHHHGTPGLQSLCILTHCLSRLFIGSILPRKDDLHCRNRKENSVNLWLNISMRRMLPPHTRCTDKFKATNALYSIDCAALISQNGAQGNHSQLRTERIALHGNQLPWSRVE